MPGKDKSYDWQRPGRGNFPSVISGREGEGYTTAYLRDCPPPRDMAITED